MLNSLTLPLLHDLWPEYICKLVIHLFPLLEIVCKFQTFTEWGHRALIPVFYCFILNKVMEKVFFLPTLLLSLSPFMYIYVENCGCLLTVWAQIYHSVTLYSLHCFKKIILLLFNYSCLHFLPTPLSHHSEIHLPPLFHTLLLLSICPL